MSGPSSLIPVDVVVPGLTPPSGGFWTDETMLDPLTGRPSWRMEDAAVFFFGRSVSWLYTQLRQNRLLLDGELMEIPRDEHGARWWRLCDIERAAHALAQNGYIQIDHLERVIGIVMLVAQNYKYLLPLPVETRIFPQSNEVRRRAIMAVETLTMTLDDLDGSEGASTRRFAIEDVHYRVDLTDANWKEFITAVQPYVAAAQPDRRKRTPSPEEVAERSTIRAWAVQQGLDIGTRGRIPEGIVAAYKAGHAQAV